MSSPEIVVGSRVRPLRYGTQARVPVVGAAMTIVTCSAYCGRAVPLARGGKRYRACKLPAKESRTIQRGFLNTYETQVHLCGTHLAMHDRGYHPPRYESDE